MLDYIPNSFFEVSFGDDVSGLEGEFISVSGLGMEFQFESYCEGGGSPRQFLTGTVGQRLVLAQGTIKGNDAFASWMGKINQGIPTPVSGTVKLKDHTGAIQREWKIEKATLVKYIGPNLNSNQAELAVTQIEMLYGGCT